MKRIFIILAAVVIIFSLAACQTTPDDPVVIQKDLEQMIEKAQETESVLETPGISLREQTDAPETLTLENTEGNFTLSVDAAVTVPDADKMPIIRVKAGEFLQEQVSAMWDALVGDTVMVEPQTQMTKSEIEEQLVIYRRSLARLDQNEPGYEESLGMLEGTITYLESIYEAAPEVIEEKPADSTLHVMEEIRSNGEVYNRYMGTEGISEDGTVEFKTQNGSINLDEPAATPEIIREESNGVSEYKVAYAEGTTPPTITFSTAAAHLNYGQTGTIEVDENTTLDESLRQYIKTTPAEARTIVTDFLEQTDAPMAVSLMELVNDEQMGIYDDVVAPAEHYAYRIECVRVVNDLPCARIQGVTAVGNDEDPMYQKTWEYEKMIFLVNDDGIIEMEWKAPIDILESKVEDSALMPFQDIQSVFEKIMSIIFQARSDGLDNLTCEINEISLEMMRIVEQDSIENGLLIPVWNFYGQEYWTLTNGNTEKRGNGVLLCINAIDGSVIDPHKGY